MRLVVLTFLTLALCSCEKPAPPADFLNELVNMQRTDRVAIGWVEGQKAEVIVFGVEPALVDVDVSPQDALKFKQDYLEQSRPIASMEGSDAQQSPDARWVTHRSKDNEFVLADSAATSKKILLDGKNVLTSLYWSSNGKYLLYVEKSGAWERGPCNKYFADGRDIMVYRIRDGQKGRIYQVCDGYPYTRFGWVRVPQSVPIS
jgi:hypothetical protein